MTKDSFFIEINLSIDKSCHRVLCKSRYLAFQGHVSIQRDHSRILINVIQITKKTNCSNKVPNYCMIVSGWFGFVSLPVNDSCKF